MTVDDGSTQAALKVQELQRKLYRAAKAQPKRTFGILYDKVCSEMVVRTAFEQVRRNRGAAGVDGITIESIEASGVERFLEELREELRQETYRPMPVRRVFIPKGDGKQRPLGIPRVKDRVAQAAVKLVIEPLFEASFRPNSFGFRPKRSAHQAIEAIRREVYRKEDVIDLDLKSYFDTIDQEILMKLVRRRVSDPRVLRLIKLWLRAGVMDDGAWEDSDLGTPQGGVISPLLANIYLHPLDLWWETKMQGTTLVRYADDMVVLCPKGSAERYMVELRKFLGRLKLLVNEEKTKLVSAWTGFDFLGATFRKQRVPKRPKCSDVLRMAVTALDATDTGQSTDCGRRRPSVVTFGKDRPAESSDSWLGGLFPSAQFRSRLPESRLLRVAKAHVVDAAKASLTHTGYQGQPDHAVSACGSRDVKRDGEICALNAER